jgi:hypothetical protein
MKRTAIKVTNKRPWKLFYSARDHAAREGEEVAKVYSFTEPPVDPFAIIAKERKLIHAEGFDFRDAFDGRIKYVGPRFLICYNTQYNRWPHHGEHHSKIIFTVAHELGHYFLEKHREYLVTSRNPHGSFTEFTADPLVEQQADAFAAGLLMPNYLLRTFVNRNNFVTQETFLEVRSKFSVSLTGLLVRWVQLSDFPCAVIVARGGKIRYGWVSKSLRSCGAYRIRKGGEVVGKAASQFINSDISASKYRSATGSGAMRNWIDFDDVRLSTEEHYFAIPHTGTVWCLATANEDDLSPYQFCD